MILRLLRVHWRCIVPKQIQGQVSVIQVKLRLVFLFSYIIPSVPPLQIYLSPEKPSCSYSSCPSRCTLRYLFTSDKELEARSLSASIKPLAGVVLPHTSKVLSTVVPPTCIGGVTLPPIFLVRRDGFSTACRPLCRRPSRSYTPGSESVQWSEIAEGFLALVSNSATRKYILRLALGLSRSILGHSLSFFYCKDQVSSWYRAFAKIFTARTQMDPHIHSLRSQLLQHTRPKETEQDMSNVAPPPYTPPRRPSLAGLTARGIELSSLSHRPVQGESRVFQRPLTTTMLPDEQEDTDGSTGLSPLSLRINTSINITKGNNLICLTESPASHANAIAEAVAQAIQNNSSGNCGIPMIDGNGNPRPVKIEVDAGMVVDGIGNVVGNEKIIDEVLRQRADLRRQDLHRPREENNIGQDLRRSRDDNDAPEPESFKRRRSE